MALLLAALATMPILPSAAWQPADSVAPSSRVLTLLAASIGLPFVLLAATAPLLQHWHARALPDLSPYRLYVLSNVGSLVALMAYPFAIEPYLDLPQQGIAWTAGLVLFVVLCGWCASIVMRGGSVARSAPEAAAAPTTAADQAAWLLLPAIGSGLLLATTADLTQNVAAMPLLWVVPLAIYLVTFILAFADRALPRVSAVAFLLLLGPALYLIQPETVSGILIESVVLLGSLTAGGLVCHGRLAMRRPPVAHLTEYYLAIGIGGAIGGAGVAVVAPIVFTSYLELPLLHLAVAGVILHGLVTGPRRREWPSRLASAVVSAAIVAGAITVVGTARPSARSLARARNFYGVLHVLDGSAGTQPRLRQLFHGQILHGAQHIDPARTNEPTTYYGTGTGVDMAIRRHPRGESGLPLTIGAVGLGAGTVAAWGRSGDRIRFFEIDPNVIVFARTYFSFLGNSKATIEITPGDARLSLEAEMADPARRHQYDVLIIDAFSGDAIPIHLLTREAFVLYQTALRPDGVLAVHVSNHYLDLRPVVRGGAAELGWRALFTARPASRLEASVGASWMLVTPNDAFMPDLPPEPGRPATLWTDAFSSLLSVLR
jgi:hypothetical protein